MHGFLTEGYNLNLLKHRNAFSFLFTLQHEDELQQVILHIC